MTKEELKKLKKDEIIEEYERFKKVYALDVGKAVTLGQISILLEEGYSDDEICKRLEIKKRALTMHKKMLKSLEAK